MTELIDLRPVWLPRGTLSNMAQTIMILFLRWPRLPLFACFFLHSWPIFQLNIKNVFLHGDLTEEVYMEQPPGFVAQWESGLVCKLRHSLYGLKQSPRAWFSRFSSVV